MHQHPNIIFTTADHLRYDILGHTGDPVIQTPAIDRLAAEGICFDQCFAQTITGWCRNWTGNWG